MTTTALLLGCAGVQAAWLTAPNATRVFVRGVGYSPYHPGEPSGLSAATKARDRVLVRGLGANCVVTWGQTTAEEVSAWWQQGIYMVPQVSYRPARQSVFVNGQVAPVPVYVDEASRRGLYEAARDLASALKENPGVIALSLGNDYSWSAYCGGLGFAYAGFDNQTVAAFRETLRQRFAATAAVGELTGSAERSVSDVLPPLGLTPAPVLWEWWRFMQGTFGDYLAQGVAGARSVGFRGPITYAFPWGVRWDPACEGSRLPSLDVLSANIFFAHLLDWGRFCVALDRLICAAGGRPVLLTETGAHTLHVDPADAARTIKQSIACALLHPELAGISVHELCDEWQLAGKPDVQDDDTNREHWGLTTALRRPKPTYAAVQEMYAFIRRFETTFQEGQAPPLVHLSQQEADWWRLGGAEGSFYERVATELYRLGVSFHLLDTEGLLQLSLKDQPHLILCDSYLPSNPDGSDDVQGRIISHIEGGADVLYISHSPWRRLYGQNPPPAELRPDGRGPLSRKYGKGHCTLIPSYALTDQELRYALEDYLADLLQARPVTGIKPPEAARGVFWRVLQDREGLWLYLVNTGDKPVPRLEIQLGQGIAPRHVTLRAADGAQLALVGAKIQLAGLNIYALIYLGKPGAPVTPEPQ